MTLAILATIGTVFIYVLASIGAVLIFVLYLLPMPDDPPGVFYEPTPYRRPDLFLNDRRVVQLFDRDDERHPEYYDQYVEVDPAATVAQRRGDMEDARDRVERAKRRLAAAKDTTNRSPSKLPGDEGI